MTTYQEAERLIGEMIFKIRRMVEELCANFGKVGPSAISNWCWPRGEACVYYSSGARGVEDKLGRCSYFERAVLPADPGLRMEYYCFKNLSSAD